MGAGGGLPLFVLVILAIFLPPIAVLLVDGLGLHLILNIVLLILTLGLGAVVHALWIVLR